MEALLKQDMVALFMSKPQQIIHDKIRKLNLSFIHPEQGVFSIGYKQIN